MTRRNDLLESVATTTADYRRGDAEASPMTPEHVDRWLSQFPSDAQMPLLAELGHVLGQTYMSRAATTKWLDRVVFDTDLIGPAGPHAFWSGTQMLDIQLNGRSQADTLQRLDASLRSELGLSIADCKGTSGTFVYLDDVLYSGSRVCADLERWIRDAAPSTAAVRVVLHTVHMSGMYQCEKRLSKAVAAAGKKIDLEYFTDAIVENRLAYKNTSSVLWPVRMESNPLLDEYLARPHRFPFEARIPGHTRSPFSSEEARQLLEGEFLKAGLEILSRCAHPKEIMRPLGFSSFGLGFGSMIVTHRNSPNNAPLALWWGVEGAANRKRWYPLFARRTYSDNPPVYDQLPVDLDELPW
jgi:hypothetical protein